MNDNDEFHIAGIDGELYFPLNPEGRLELWNSLKNSIHNICSKMEEIADTLDGKPWFRNEMEKDISADDFRAAYECLCSMTDKLEDYTENLLLDAEQFNFNKHCNHLREFGLEPDTFDAFSSCHYGFFDMVSHPAWVAEFKLHQDISVEDTRHACEAFLEDWKLHRKKDAAGFWQYLPPSKRKEE